MKRICELCGKEFNTPDHQVKRGRGKYCSIWCSNAMKASLGGIAMREKYPLRPALNPELAGWSRKLFEKNKAERKPCSICNNPKADAHHDNYAEPLVVIWLCRKHHIERHIGI